MSQIEIKQFQQDMQFYCSTLVSNYKAIFNVLLLHVHLSQLCAWQKIFSYFLNPDLGRPSWHPDVFHLWGNASFTALW